MYKYTFTLSDGIGDKINTHLNYYAGLGWILVTHTVVNFSNTQKEHQFIWRK